MTAFIKERIPGGREQTMWNGAIDLAPRPGEFLLLIPDGASHIVDSVEWDFSGDEPNVTIWVR